MIDLVAYYAKRNDKALEGGFGGLDSLRFFWPSKCYNKYIDNIRPVMA